jgi:hypothetical protein
MAIILGESDWLEKFVECLRKNDLDSLSVTEGIIPLWKHSDRFEDDLAKINATLLDKLDQDIPTLLTRMAKWLASKNLHYMCNHPRSDGVNWCAKIVKHSGSHIGIKYKLRDPKPKAKAKKARLSFSVTVCPPVKAMTADEIQRLELEIEDLQKKIADRRDVMKKERVAMAETFTVEDKISLFSAEEEKALFERLKAKFQ